MSLIYRKLYLYSVQALLHINTSRNKYDAFAALAANKYELQMVINNQSPCHDITSYKTVMTMEGALHVPLARKKKRSLNPHSGRRLASEWHNDDDIPARAHTQGEGGARASTADRLDPLSLSSRAP